MITDRRLSEINQSFPDVVAVQELLDEVYHLRSVEQRLRGEIVLQLREVNAAKGKLGQVTVELERLRNANKAISEELDELNRQASSMPWKEATE